MSVGAKYHNNNNSLCQVQIVAFYGLLSVFSWNKIKPSVEKYLASNNRLFKNKCEVEANTQYTIVQQ